METCGREHLNFCRFPSCVQRGGKLTSIGRTMSRTKNTNNQEAYTFGKCRRNMWTTKAESLIILKVVCVQNCKGLAFKRNGRHENRAELRFDPQLCKLGQRGGYAGSRRMV